MRTTLTLILVGSALVALVACAGANLGPEAARAVAVTLSTTNVTPPVAASASLRGAGDSAVAIVVRAATCGKTASADGAVASGRLAITITLTAYAPQTCDPIYGSTTYRAVARGLAAGTYDASVDYRYVFGTTVTDSTLSRASITLP